MNRHSLPRSHWAKPTEDELLAEVQADSNLGWCVNCGEWTHEMCEPDAEEYECPACGEFTVYAAFSLLVREAYQ